MEIIGQVFLPLTSLHPIRGAWTLITIDFCVQGASGSVYSAIDTRTGKKVAVKQMIMSKYVPVSFSFFPHPGG
jgi:hypothetical protein